MTVKKIISLILSLALLCSFAACQQKNYSDTVDLDTLFQAIDLKNETEYLTAENDFLDDYFSEPDYVKDSKIQFAANGNANLDEFGIYHVTNGNAKKMAALLESYLSDSYEKNKSWYESYIAQDLPKIRDAEVRVYGNYVVYAILSEADRTTLFTLIENELKQ